MMCGVPAALFGAYVFPGAIFEDEEKSLISTVDKTPWAPSQAGRSKQVRQDFSLLWKLSWYL